MANGLFITLIQARDMAVLHGATAYGAIHWFFTPAQLAELSKEERETVARVSKLELDQPLKYAAAEDLGTTPHWHVVKGAIRAETARYLELQQDRKDKYEAEVQEALASPEEEWFTTWFACPKLQVPGKYHRVNADLRVLERLEALQPELQRRYAEWESQEAAKIAARKAAQEAEQAARAAAKEDLRKWALQYGPAEMQRGVAEDYEVEESIMDFVASIVTARVGGFSISEARPEWGSYDWYERKNPNAAAFEVLDQATSAVASIRSKIPESVSVEVSRVLRIERDATEYAEVFTGVVVTLAHPSTKDRAIILSAE